MFRNTAETKVLDVKINVNNVLQKIQIYSNTATVFICIQIITDFNKTGGKYQNFYIKNEK